jgi:hypothetical protein
MDELMAIDNCHLDYVRALGRDAEGREPEQIGGGHRVGPRPHAEQQNYDRREALPANGTLVIFDAISSAPISELSRTPLTDSARVVYPTREQGAGSTSKKTTELITSDQGG